MNAVCIGKSIKGRISGGITSGQTTYWPDVVVSRKAVVATFRPSGWTSNMGRSMKRLQMNISVIGGRRI